MRVEFLAAAVSTPRTSSRSGALAAGASLAGVGVALGAFGAHGLRAVLNPVELAWWETAASYQVWHGLALLAIGVAGSPRLRVAAWLIGSGAVIFSGTLYLMALTEMRWLGAVTPIGGVLMIGGWAVLAWHGWRGMNQPASAQAAAEMVTTSRISGSSIARTRSMKPISVNRC
jgi:uncharacterized membrane protein YgdD (TMEM256/DUF423 family)